MPTIPQQHNRISLADLKSQIVKRIGPERARHYFGNLNKFLSQKITKVEFEKQCLAAVGKENLALHNRLVWSILRNASLCKTPLPRVDVPRSVRSNEGQRLVVRPSVSVDVWMNGNGHPQSPRKARTGLRDKRLKDRPSPLGPNGWVEAVSSQAVAPMDCAGPRVNGGLVPHDLRRSVPQNMIGGVEQPLTMQQMENSIHCDGVPANRENFSVYEDGGMAMHAVDAMSLRASIQAPLGISFCSASHGAAHRPQPLLTKSGVADLTSSSDAGELCHTEVLKQRMDQIAKAHGLGGVTLDCANALNNSVDVYLKQLIKSCVNLCGAGPGCEPKRHLICEQLPQAKIINGVRPTNRVHVQGTINRVSEGSQDRTAHSSISLSDFRVAMEQNPQQLGLRWPFLLEKICHRSWEQ